MKPVDHYVSLPEHVRSGIANVVPVEYYTGKGCLSVLNVPAVISRQCK